MNNVIKIEPGERLYGIRFWVQWYASPPKMEVFAYAGRDRSHGLYWFRSRRSGALISKAFYQLNANGFKPFCIDIKRVDEWVEEHGS